MPAKKEQIAAPVEKLAEACRIVWSEPDAEGHRHFEGLECDSIEARDLAARDMESRDLVVRVAKPVRAE